MRRSYFDRTNGVGFSYPAGWTLNGDDDAATAKLRITSDVNSNAVVTLEGAFADQGPYKGTDFVAGAFAYVVKNEATEAQCYETLARNGDDQHQSVDATWNGGPSKKLDIPYTMDGSTDGHSMVATYRRGRCYLFETVIVSMSPDASAKPLPPARWDLISGEFAAVMQSVRILPVASGKGR
jgi:hypothetical protein